MRLGRERPRKEFTVATGASSIFNAFNEAGARTPQKGGKPDAPRRADPRPSMRLGRERPRKEGGGDHRSASFTPSMRLGRERPRKVQQVGRLMRASPGLQ